MAPIRSDSEPAKGPRNKKTRMRIVSVYPRTRGPEPSLNFSASRAIAEVPIAVPIRLTVWAQKREINLPFFQRLSCVSFPTIDQELKSLIKELRYIQHFSLGLDLQTYLMMAFKMVIVHNQFIPTAFDDMQLSHRSFLFFAELKSDVERNNRDNKIFFTFSKGFQLIESKLIRLNTA